MTKTMLKFIEEFNNYPSSDVYLLSYKFGRRLIEFLGEERFRLLLDSQVLLSFSNKKLYCILDSTYKLHPAAKSLEGFLLKLIKGKSLAENSNDSIGEVFGKKDNLLRKKIKNKKLIAKTKTVWEYCRNDIMHYSDSLSERNLFNGFDLYKDITDVIVELYKDFYGKSEPDIEIMNGFTKYIIKSRKRPLIF